MLTRSASARSALVAVAGLLLGGCVTEAEMREASRLPRPAMPKATAEPRPPPAIPGEDAIVEAAVQLSRKGDCARAARALETLEDRGGRERLARKVAAVLAADDAPGAMRFALALPSGFAQTAALKVAARASVRADAAAAARWALEFSEPSAAATVRRAVGEALADADPRGAVTMLMAQPAGRPRDEMLGAAVGRWAQGQPREVEAWLRGLPDDPLRQRCVASAGIVIAQTEPQRAIALAELLPAGRDRWLLHTAITQTWVAVDATAAFAWTNGLPAGEPREAAIAGLDAGLGIAVTRRVTEPPDLGGSGGSRAGGGGARTVEIWRDPAFVAWSETQPAGRSEEEMVLAFVRERSAAAPFIVEQWVATLPSGAIRARAMEALCESLSLVEAARWLRSLPRSDRSDAMIERTAREWSRIDPAAAAAWLRDLGWAPDGIEAMIHRGNGR